MTYGGRQPGLDPWLLWRAIQFGIFGTLGGTAVAVYLEVSGEVPAGFASTLGFACAIGGAGAAAAIPVLWANRHRFRRLSPDQ